ncbi:MAG: urea transporter [Brumimicrobium sp.]|nr:urea transporter [Brumimicrobium sp.]MCO5268584.1 urea transporter [Brumimicrobium sp.]
MKAPVSPISKNRFLLQPILNGIGQIMLQENRLSGILILTGICYGSLVMGGALLVGTIVASFTAKFLSFDSEKLTQGIYGFNGALVGAGLAFFVQNSFLLWLIIIAGAWIATVIQQLFIKRNIPVFTLPFVMVTWMVLYFYSAFSSESLQTSTTMVEYTTSEFILYPIRGFSQIIFQDNLIAGGVILLAIIISSPIAGIIGLIISILSGILAYAIGIPMETIGLGLTSYNAILSTIVFAGSKIKDMMWVITAVLLTLIFSFTMFRLGWTQLTFPFVAGSCLTLAIKWMVEKK